MQTPWQTIWAACWSSLPAARAAAIEEYLSEKVDGLSGGELQAAIEYIANQSSGEEKFGSGAPSVKTLEYTIRNLRKQKRGIDTSEPYDVSDAKRIIRDVRTSDDSKWEVICQIATTHGAGWAYKLESYAVSHGGLKIPWFVPVPLHHKQATQEKRPDGVLSAVDMMRKIADTQKAVIID